MSCSKLKKQKCTDPCKWVKNKGCVNQIASASKPSKCPRGTFINPMQRKCVDVYLVGKGSYGCVISPPITDKEYTLKTIIPYTDKDNGDVGKLFFYDDDFREELDFVNYIKKIDPNNEFTVKCKGALQLSSKCTEFNETISYCLYRHIKHLNQTAFYQIIFEYGGVQLNTLNKYTITYIQFLQMFKELITGMITLQNNNIIHQDIKPHNVIINTHKKKLNLIDFGLMCKHWSQLYSSKNTSSLKYFYPYYPPEFYIAYIMLHYRDRFENNKAAFDTFVDTIYQRLEINGYLKQSHIAADPYIFQEFQYGILSFLETIKKTGFTKYDDIFNKEIAMKADVFAVASLIASMSNNIQFKSREEQQFVDYIYQRCFRANPYERVSFAELYSIISSEEMRTLSQSAMGVKGGSIKSTLQKLKFPFMKMAANKLRYIFNRNYRSPSRHRSRSDTHQSASRRSLITSVVPKHIRQSQSNQEYSLRPISVKKNRFSNLFNYRKIEEKKPKSISKPVTQKTKTEIKTKMNTNSKRRTKSHSKNATKLLSHQ